MARSPSPFVCTNLPHVGLRIVCVSFVHIFTEMACTICRMDFLYKRLRDYKDWPDEVVGVVRVA